MKFENGRIVIESGTELGILDIIGAALIYFGLSATGNDPSIIFLTGSILILMGTMNTGLLRYFMFGVGIFALFVAVHSAGFL